MSKMTLTVAATAILGFAAGILTEPRILPPQSVQAATITPSTISPIEMHRQLKPDDVPVQFMKPSDFY